MAEPLDTLLDWIHIDSVSGHEGDYGDALSRRLAGEGLGVERQELAPGRFNVLARGSAPLVVFCTHLDTVPPWFGGEREGQVITGRGSCDAKGPALAMIEAGRRLLASGEDRIGYLFTVAEETDGSGAQAAEARRTSAWQPRYTIVGEPTENRFCRGGKGVYKCDLHARGVAGHSSEPIGPSAVHELVNAIHRLLSSDWGHHAVFGEGTINFGRIEGGLAANVVAPEASAMVLVRAVEEPEVVEARIREHLGDNVELVATKGYGPVEFVLPEGEEGPVIAFGTDAPYLRSWGRRLLYGPGSISDAHTEHEKITVPSFERAVADYERVARELLARVDAGGGAGEDPGGGAGMDTEAR